MVTLTLKVKQFAKDLGADLVGVCPSFKLQENAEEHKRILPGHQSLVVVAVKHSVTALRSSNVKG